MTVVVQVISIVSFIITIILAIILWFKRRETHELNMQHKMELQKMEHDSEKSIRTSEQKVIKEYTEDRFLRLEARINELHDKASGRHSEIQGKLGHMEVDLKVFMTEQSCKIEQIFGIIQGRRSADKQKSA